MRPSAVTAAASVNTSAGAADAAAAEVHEMPVVGEAVGARVLAHRRDDDAVRQRQRAERQRIEEVRHTCIIAGPSHPSWQPLRANA